MMRVSRIAASEQSGDVRSTSLVEYITNVRLGLSEPHTANEWESVFIDHGRPCAATTHVRSSGPYDRATTSVRREGTRSNEKRTLIEMKLA